MYCSTCNTQNLATSVRCIQCGTTLIHEAVGHSDAFRKGALMIDTRMYSGIGAFLGLILAALLISTVFEYQYGSGKFVFPICVIAGSLVGRFIAWSKWRN